jgi:sortase A
VKAAGTRRSWVRSFGLALIVSGALGLAWVVVVWQWQDPFTALYTLYEQHELAQSYDQRVRAFRPTVIPRDVVLPRRHLAVVTKSPKSILEDEQRVIAVEARSYRRESHEGQALGRIIVPRLGLNMIFVDGTSESSLARGPGRDLQTHMPGEGRLVYIAGHRTTFLAPFSHIDALRRGDKITLELPYATFVYVVTWHTIVLADDLSVLRPGKRELLALQACHPRFFATHRYIVYARPIRIIPNRGGRPYSPQ